MVCIKAFDGGYTSSTWSRKQFPGIQNILHQQENHSRVSTTMSRDVLNVQIGVSIWATHIRVYQQSLSPRTLRSRILIKIRKVSIATSVVAERHTICIIFLHNLDSIGE
jgi:hypothetical protein